MARKLKIKSPKEQLTLFDFSEEFMPETSKLPVHPSIEAFVMESASEKTATETFDDGTIDLMQPINMLTSVDSISFISFGSGSSGNCSYIGDSTGGFLIDAGVDVDKIKEGLEHNGLSMENVKGICLTHDHSDHVRYVYSLVRKYRHIGVYCTPRTFNGIMRRHSISRRLKDYHRPIYKEFPFKIGDFDIVAFEVSHDGTDNSGFFITHGHHRFAVATDLGCVTPRVDHYMRMAQYIMIESNYDKKMLAEGRYPAHLKARIKAENGHLSNDDAARFLAQCCSDRLRYIFLCHLSADNNTPELALDAVRSALASAGFDEVGNGDGSIESRRCGLQLMVLPRYDASPLITLRHVDD